MAYEIVADIFGKRAVVGERVTHMISGSKGTIAPEVLGHPGCVMVKIDGMGFAIPLPAPNLIYHGKLDPEA